MELNVDLSRKVRDQVAAEDKECYLNAFRATPLLPGAVLPWRGG
jgi:hypothetical protein